MDGSRKMTVAAPRTRRTSELAAGVSVRMFWLCLLLLHGAALPSLWTAVEGGSNVADHWALLTRLTGMALSSAFFVLKILDVRWLRLKPGWRTAVVAVVVISVMHVGVVDRAIHGELYTDPAHLGLVFFVGSLCHVEPLKRAINLLRGIATPVRLWRVRRGDWFARYWETVLRPGQRRYVPAYAGPRAPPLA